MLVLFFYLICILPATANGDRVWGEACSVDSHCIAHLTCVSGKCIPPNAPSQAQCQTRGFVYKDKLGQPINSPWDMRRSKSPIQCPPFCGHVKDVVFGPICTLTKGGCARSQDCRVYGRCGFNGKRCIYTAAGCARSSTCTKEGWCGFRHNHCRLTEEGCARSSDCKALGNCGLDLVLVSGNPLVGKKNDRYGERCVATPTGCAQSDRCKQTGLCAFTAMKVDKCQNGQLRCFTPPSCVKGPPTPEAFPTR